MLRRVISVRQKTITFRSYGCWDDRNLMTIERIEKRINLIKSQEELYEARLLLVKVKYNIPFNQKDNKILNEQLELPEDDDCPNYGYDDNE